MHNYKIYIKLLKKVKNNTGNNYGNCFPLWPYKLRLFSKFANNSITINWQSTNYTDIKDKHQ